MGYRLPLGRIHQITSTGTPQSGALLYVYENTTTTPLAVYSDRAGTAAAANPIVADSTGRLPVRYVLARAPVTLVCKTSAGVTIWSDDNIDPELGAEQGLLADGDAMTGPLAFSSHGNIASAATVDLDTLDGNYAVLTGTTTVTAWGTVQAGARFWLRCAAATPITHNATSAICQAGASFTTEAGDMLELLSEGGGNWRIFLWRGTGSPPGVLATVAEINRAADVSTRQVACGSTLAMTEAAHEGKTILLDTVTGSVATLPASTGGGAVYRFLVLETATSNSHIIKVANASDEMRGYVIQDSDTATAPNTWWAVDNDDTITLNRTSTGLAAQGEYFEVVDAKLNHFYVRGYSQASGVEATPFSATV